MGRIYWIQKDSLHSVQSLGERASCTGVGFAYLFRNRYACSCPALGRLLVMELSQLFLGIVSLLISLLTATFCALGGRDKPFILPQRIWGRWIAPLFFTGCLIAFNHHWLVLISPITYLLAWRIGHGYNGDLTLTKIGVRAVSGGTKVLASLPVIIATGRYDLFLLQAFFGIMGSIILGTTNGEPAPREELLINFCCIFVIPFAVI